MSNTRPSVLITGCSSPGGIGQALAREYHSKGFQVFATARRHEVLSDLAQSGITTLALDVTNLESIRAARDKVAETTGGRLDVLVNNAGAPFTSPAIDVDVAGVRSMFETNLFGVMIMVQEFVHLVIAAKGQILNVGSTAGIVGTPFFGAYSASKAALHAYGDALRIELKPFGVTVVSIVTGGIKTNMSQGLAKSGDSKPFRQGSLYTAMSSIFLKGQAKIVKSVSGYMPETYAARVVNATWGRHPSGRIYKGTFASRLWWATFLLPTSFLEFGITKMIGLGEMQGLLEKEQKGR